MTITHIRTHTALQGSDIREGARAARLVAEHHITRPDTKSDAALAREDVRRAANRERPTAKHPQGRGTRHFETIVRKLHRAGGDIVEACEFDLDDPDQARLAEWLLNWLDRKGL